jgi:galactokinase
MPFGPDPHRVERLTVAFEAAFGHAAPPDRAASAAGRSLEIVRAPGSVHLMGDHTDYDEGFVLPAAIGLETWIAFRRRRDGLVRIASPGQAGARTFWIDDLAPGSVASADGAVRGWWDYVAGTAWSLREAALPIRGFDGIVDSAIPPAIGLSSSAALELASALALLSGTAAPTEPALAALAQRAERDYVGVDRGIVGQLAGATGREGRALLLDCRSLESRLVALPWGVRLVVCDTGSPRQPHARALKDRRAECGRAVALLSERIPGLWSLRDVDAALLRRHRAILPPAVARRAEHVVAENGRVVATAAAMESNDLDELGRLFAESHASLRDLYEVGSPALDAMVGVALAVPGVVAARMTGQEFGGCTVNLVLADAVPALVAAVQGEYRHGTGLRGIAYPVAIVDGAGPVSKGKP